MPQANGQDVSPLLDTLDLEQLQRLKKLIVITAPNATNDQIDWPTVVSEIRNPSPLQSEPHPEAFQERNAWRRKIDGGRRFELTLWNVDNIGNNPGLRGEERDRRYEREWLRAKTLHADGMTYPEAWKQIRAECSRSGSAGSAYRPSGSSKPKRLHSNRKRLRRRRRERSKDS